MKYSRSVIFLIFWLTASFGPAHADETVRSVTLEQIYTKMNSIKTLSYQSKIRSPAGNMARTKIWIKGNKVRAQGDRIKAGQIGKRGYQYFGDRWIESPGFSINTVITFLKEAHEADDTKIIGEQIINGEDTTIIEYTRPRWDNFSNVIKVKLWVSNKNFVPIKIQAVNITENKIQTEEISNISFEKIDETVFDDILKKDEQVKRQAKEKWISWMEAKEKGYQGALKMDEDLRYTPKQKEIYWESILSSICKDNPYSVKDDEMRAYARSRLLYWMDKESASSPTPPSGSPSAENVEIGRDSTYIAYANGVVEDTMTGLEWIAGLDADTNWNDAQNWVQSLTVDGGGWRMPTRDELKTLYKKGAGKSNMTPLLKISGFSVWSGEKKDSSTAWKVDFFGGRTSYRVIPIDCDRCMLTRAFAVRSKHNK
ncbi:MAG: DUF1566 domain-containing protein [Desulfobacteraceae bacterium]|nr:DUF1566 domain-containing protein [Desulfobacteraceae bacterium]